MLNIVTKQPRNSILRCMYKRNENKRSHKNADTNDHRNIIHDQKVETTKCPLSDEYINNMWYTSIKSSIIWQEN